MSVASDWLAWYKLAKWPGGLIGLFGWFLIGVLAARAKRGYTIGVQDPPTRSPLPISVCLPT